jgi:hypothetical protein
MMDRKYIDEHHVVARYLANDLSAAEREAFEAYYVDDPEVARDLEAAARFKAGLAQMRNDPALAALLAPRPWYREQSGAWIAAAAGLLLASGVAYSLYSYPPLQPVLVATRDGIRNWRGALPLADYQLVTKSRRGAEAQIELPDSSQLLELRLLLGTNAPSPPYRITLSSAADDVVPRIIATLDEQPPAADGFVRLFINSSRVHRGRYRVLITGAGNAQAEYQLLFQ